MISISEKACACNGVLILSITQMTGKGTPFERVTTMHTSIQLYLVFPFYTLMVYAVSFEDINLTLKNSNHGFKIKHIYVVLVKL